jgi:hypothetical protein
MAAVEECDVRISKRDKRTNPKPIIPEARMPVFIAIPFLEPERAHHIAAAKMPIIIAMGGRIKIICGLKKKKGNII